MSDANDVEADIAGQRIKIRDLKSANTIITILTFVGVWVLGYALWIHQEHARDSSRQFVEAVKEQTSIVREQMQAAREQNCLLRLAPEERASKADFCRMIAR